MKLSPTSIIPFQKINIGKFLDLIEIPHARKYDSKTQCAPGIFNLD